MDNKNKKNNKAKPVAKCDQLGKVVANCDLLRSQIATTKSAEERIVLIDNFVDDRVLSLNYRFRQNLY